MADVRTFKAATMQEALDIVRREMGPEAVILHTREVPKPKLLRWVGNKERVEITAGLGVNIRPPAVRYVPRPAMISRSTTAATRAAAGDHGSGHASSEQRPPQRPLPRHEVDENLAPPPSLLPPRSPAAGIAASPAAAYSAPPGAARAPSTPAPAPTQRPLDAFSYDRGVPPEERFQPGLPVQAPPTPVISTAASMASVIGTGDSQHAAISQQLNSIRQMVEKLSRNSMAGRGEDIPEDLFQLYTGLIDAEVDEDLARELIFRLKESHGSDHLHDPATAKLELLRMVEADIRCSRPITATRGRQKVVALVGPTGVGKTTTIAKLAANFRLREGIRMGLVTVDTYRIAAVEQLRTYAEIIDLPMKVVTSPREMRRALDELSGLDLVLIDTAGRSPRDELKIQELKSLLTEARVDEVHLVLSLVASLRSLEATVEKFSVANTTSMILTKLDEAAGMGSLLSLARKVSLPISYLTTGQNVPDDIEAANASRISRLVLGQESVLAGSRL